MKKIISITCAVLCMSSFTSFAIEKTITASDGFPLSVDYFEPKLNSSKGVLMLHQCNYDRSMYKNIGKKLADKGIHAVSVDFRGFGKSINSDFDMSKMESLDENTRGKRLSAMYKKWPSDVSSVLNFFNHQIGTAQSIAVVGASCGGSLAIRMSDEQSFSALVLFSSAQGEKNQGRYKSNLSNTPTLLITSEEDTDSYDSALKIYKNAHNPASKLVVYKGDAHGYPLYQQDKSLETEIVSWLQHNLN